MTDRLKLSDPKGDAQADKISDEPELAAHDKRIAALERNVSDPERLYASEATAVPRQQTTTRFNKIGARKSGSFKAISTAPSINMTPVGNRMVPVAYPLVQDLSNSINVSTSVRFNGQPVYLLDSSSQPGCKGDEPGTGGGVRSGTVGGEVKPVGGSRTVRVQGKQVVRQGDACTMNGGNNPGIYVMTPPSSSASPKDAIKTSNPPITLDMPEEKSAFEKWRKKTETELLSALRHPVDGIVGAAKGIGNIGPGLGELLLNSFFEQRATELADAARTQTLFGSTEAATNLGAIATEVRKNGEQIELPKFKMVNAAEEGGDKISTALQMFAAGAGILKGAARLLGKLTRGQVATKGNAAAANAGSIVTQPAAKGMRSGDGVKVLPRARPRVLRTMSRDDMAQWLREKHGITDKAKLNDMLESANLSKPVNLVELSPGTEVYQYVRENGSVGTFFAYPGTSADALAISSEGRVLTKFILEEPIQVIECTAAPFPIGKYPGVGGTGGGVQLIFPKGVTVPPVPTGH